ncbi:MAG TPA: gamma-glutamylcyclotransferase [Alphaproteobacteria bacterium]|nr:gamma-glutamylcyclotransferase [Alphaproteobacteria bacterium]
MIYTRETIRDGLFAELAEEGHRLGVFRRCTEHERAESRQRMLRRIAPDQDIWVFGYGSLMWNPAIRFRERAHARLYGWHRSFCLWAPVGRGTPENPGLVLALDRGGSCHGITYRIAATDRDTELDLLWQREMVSDGYRPRWVRVHCGSRSMAALTWVINRAGQRFAGKLPLAVIARHLATAGGRLGTSRDYLENTITHLDELGIRERRLHRIRDAVRAIELADGGR